MRKRVVVVLFAALVAACYSQVRPTAQKWSATLRVVDEMGQPVAGAEVVVSFAVPPSPQATTASDKIAGLTDTNGVFRASHRDRSVYLGFHAQKAGYYSYLIQHDLGFSDDDNQVKWNPTVTLVLKTIRNPIPMYARWVKSGPPVFNKPVGYDLIAGDWTAPDGKGLQTDIIFTGRLDKQNDDHYDYALTVSFPNPGDGIQEFRIPPLPSGEGSSLRSPHEAPQNGYQAQLVRTMNRHPGQGTKNDSDGSRNYFLRIRSVVDEHGKLKSALYGKIYGDFMSFRYYLNPTANDRNVEYDPKHNLLKGLKSFEDVTAP